MMKTIEEFVCGMGVELEERGRERYGAREREGDRQAETNKSKARGYAVLCCAVLCRAVLRRAALSCAFQLRFCVGIQRQQLSEAAGDCCDLAARAGQR